MCQAPVYTLYWRHVLQIAEMKDELDKSWPSTVQDQGLEGIINFPQFTNLASKGVGTRTQFILASKPTLPLLLATSVGIGLCLISVSMTIPEGALSRINCTFSHCNLSLPAGWLLADPIN